MQPAPNLERATARLRGALRVAIAAATTQIPDWTTQVVNGPTAIPVPGGKHWCRYTGTVDTRPTRT